MLCDCQREKLNGVLTSINFYLVNWFYLVCYVRYCFSNEIISQRNQFSDDESTIRIIIISLNINTVSNFSKNRMFQVFATYIFRIIITT